LLATATDDRVSHQAHPSFAEIIKQLSAAEAKELLEILGEYNVPIVRLLVAGGTEGNLGHSIAHNHVLPYSAEPDGPPIENPAVAVWVDNWIRLGLVNVDYGSRLIREGFYDYAKARPEYERLVAQSPAGVDDVMITEGVLRSTNFGLRFKAAVTPGRPGLWPGSPVPPCGWESY